MRKNRRSVSAARAGHVGAWVALLCLAASATAGTKLYKWVDAQGVTHWSDTPVDGATKVDVPPPQSYSAPPKPRVSPPPSAPVAKTPPAEELNGGYTRLAIVQPAPDEAFANVSNIDIRAETEPSLAPSHDPYIVLDGQRVANALSVIVPAVRGSHTVVLQIENSAGKIIAATEPVTFHVQQPSVATPPRGPALKGRPTRR